MWRWILCFFDRFLISVCICVERHYDVCSVETVCSSSTNIKIEAREKLERTLRPGSLGGHVGSKSVFPKLWALRGTEQCVVLWQGSHGWTCINTSATTEAGTGDREAAAGHGGCKTRLKRHGSCMGPNLNGLFCWALVSLLLHSPTLQVFPSLLLRHILLHKLPALVIFKEWEHKLVRVCGTYLSWYGQPLFHELSQIKTFSVQEKL